MQILKTIFEALVPAYLPFVIFGIILRLRRRQWQSGDSWLLGILIGYFILSIIQFVVCGGYIGRRYLMIVTPITFGWAGVALAEIWKFKNCRFLYLLAILGLVYKICQPTLRYLWNQDRRDEMRLSYQMAEIIKRDWQGEQFYRPTLKCRHYISPKKPTLNANQGRYFSTIGFLCGGSRFQTNVVSPIEKPDYYIFVNEEVSGPYLDIWSGEAGKYHCRVGKLIKP